MMIRSLNIEANYFLLSVINDSKWIISLLIGLLTFYIVKFYYNVKQYPNGPFPLPFIGNLLMFKGMKENAFELLGDLAKKYGSTYTFWMGPFPNIIICDLKAAKDAFYVTKNEIAGRPHIEFVNDLFDGFTGVTVADYGPTWESLRRVGHASIRKSAVDDQLPFLIKDVVNEVFDKIKENEGFDKPFEPFDYLYFIIYNIMGPIAFKKRLDNNSEISRLIRLNRQQQNVDSFIMFLLFVCDYIPCGKKFVKKDYEKFQFLIRDAMKVITTNYKSHVDNFQEGIVDDFTDHIIMTKKQAMKVGKESAPYLIDENLAFLVSDLFIAGSDTVQFTLRWMLLLMANYPEMQRKMKKEIEEVIGDRTPVQDDKNNCHFINAFISETLRFRPVVPMGVAHKTLCDVKIGEYNIAKDTVVSLNLYAIMNDPKVFTDPDKFNPGRFLDSNGKFSISRFHGFLPFGIGRRVCPGEKLGLANLFLIIANILQYTFDFEFALPNGPNSGDLRPNPNAVNVCVPLPYQFMLIKT